MRSKYLGLCSNRLDLPVSWRMSARRILKSGAVVFPRGLETLEVLHNTMEVSMRQPVLTVPERKLSYQFMAAEAYWILTGDDRVETISPYNSRISDFSDDGIRFFGAYGPEILSQLDYVVDKLKRDVNTRQAGLTIWRKNPPITKDVPCTVSVFFTIRKYRLNCHVFMRSSDVWLGIPYDVFNFSMLSHLVCCRINNNPSYMVDPGILYLTAASSHVYRDNINQLKKCLDGMANETIQHKTPSILFNDEVFLMDALKKLRDSKPGSALRWWENSYAT